MSEESNSISLNENVELDNDISLKEEDIEATSLKVEETSNDETTSKNVLSSSYPCQVVKIDSIKESKLPNEFSSPNTMETEEERGDVKLKNTAENDSSSLDGSTAQPCNVSEKVLEMNEPCNALGDSTAKQKDDYEDNQSIYNVKWIKYQNKSLPIITQNENGPCPLLAIMNYLLLQQRIELQPSTELVTSSNLISHLADYIFEHVPKHINPDTRLNYEQKMNDAIAMFPKLQTGLDVNIRFTGVADFEYTSSCEVFDLLDIPLFHGWLVDPESFEVVAAVGHASYNQLVEKIINMKSSLKSEEAGQAIVAEEFLRSSASQITYHGLSELSSTLKDSQMGVLFRNNHFHTLLKHNGELYVLATDQGFLHEAGVVWETLSNIEGDSHFVDAGFRVFQQSASKPSVQTTSFTNTTEQIDQDYLVALSLQREQAETVDQFSNWANLSDHEIAMKLQEEENKRAEATPLSTDRQQTPTSGPQRQRVSTVSSSSVGKDKKSLCSVM